MGNSVVPVDLVIMFSVGIKTVIGCFELFLLWDIVYFSVYS